MTTSAFPIPDAPTRPGVPADLPVHLTQFIGREQELSELARLLGAARLITLTGAGGSGKTRLAREAAAQAAPAFARVAWVDLAPLAEPSQVVLEVATALQAGERGASLVESIIATIGDSVTLLVLDNCEHLVDACAELVELLMRGCARLRVLATSREALSIPGETAWLVPRLAGAEAIQLFVERAQGSLPSFTLTDANVDAVREICRRLDGIPLAIELAAARVRVLSPEQIAGRLHDAFRLLTSGSRTAVPRHRTLRGTMDWSYHLLSEREQVLLRRLAIFPGSFSLEAAEDVCAGAPLESEDTLDGVAALVDKSLVVMEPGEARVRYRLLETVRQYGVEQLAAAAGIERCRERHGRHFLAFAEAVAPHLIAGADQPELMARVGAEHDNLRAAAAWAASDPARGAESLRFTDALFWYQYGTGSWYGTGQFREARQTIAGALARGGGADPLLRGRALAAEGLNAFAQGDYAESRASLETSLALVRAHGDAASVAFVLSKLGAVHIMLGDPLAAGRLLDESFEIVRGTSAPVLRAYVCLWRGWAAHVRGDDALARAMLEEAVALGGRLSHRATFAHASALLGRVEYAQGHYGRAFARLSEALRTDLEVGDGWGLGLDLEGMVGLAVARGHHADGAQLMGAVDALRDRIGIALPMSDRPERERLIGIARQQLGAGFERLYQAGRALSMDDIVRLATDRAAEHTAEYRVPRLDEPVSVPPLVIIPATVPAPPPSLRVMALGPLQVFIGDDAVDATAWGSARPRELLVYLLMHPEGRTKEQVGLAFWPEASAAQLRNNFHVTLHRLRKALRNPAWITLANDRYRIDAAVVREFDVFEFEREVVAARRALARREEGAPAALERALARFHGDFLDGEPVGDWHVEHRDRLQRLYVEALTELAARLAKEERWAKAADVYRRVLARDDLHEDAARALMLCHARLGERAQALQLYLRFAARLREELDAEPDEETVELYERVQRGRI